jgi:hypothetical protein
VASVLGFRPSCFLLAEIAVSNPAEGMNVCLLCLCVAGRGLCVRPIACSGES